MLLKSTEILKYKTQQSKLMWPNVVKHVSGACTGQIRTGVSLHMSRPQSGHRMSSLQVRKPRPTRDTQHFLQLKQSLCH